MRACDCILAENYIYPRSLDSTPDDIAVERQDPLHRRESLFGVAGRAEEAIFISEIILDHEAGLRIEVCAVLSHKFEIVVGCHRAMLDLSAAGERGGAHRVLVSVDERAHSLFVRFVASGVELILWERHAAALTYGLRGED